MTTTIDIADKIKNPSALSQEQGDIIYNAIISAFEKGEIVSLDFKNVESMITPFLNNAIGQLYGQYTSEFIKNHLDFVNFPASKIPKLNIVISNAKNFYANKKNFTKTAKDVLNIE